MAVAGGTVEGGISLPEGKKRRPWLIAAMTLVVLALVGLLILFWMGQARRGREELRRTMESIAQMDRPALARQWGEKLSWTPSADAPAALAVMPKHQRLEFDALYAAYDGQRVVATLALTSIGGLFNGMPLDRTKYPERLIERPLSAEELRGLELLIALLRERVRAMDPQSDRARWTQAVLATAEKIRAGQAAGEQVGTGPGATIN